MSSRRRFLLELAAHNAGLMPLPEDPDARATREILAQQPTPHARTIVEEARRGWWSGQAGMLLGQQFQGVIQGVGVERGILAIDGIAEPQMLTVSLSRSDVRDPSVIGGTNGDVFARVRYGIGGASDSFEIDWATGMQFSVTATTLRVSAVSFAPNFTVAYAPRLLDLTAGIVKNPRPGALPPSRSFFFRVDAGGVVGVVVPDFARQVSVDGFEGAGTTIFDAATRVDFVNVVGNLLGRYDGTELVRVQAVTIPGQARLVAVRNTALVARTYTLTFGLCL